MASAELEFRLEGPSAPEVAEELSAQIAAEFGLRPKLSRRGTAPQSHRETVRGDPLALAALILSIPAALLAADDLAKRLELKPKADRLIAWAKERLRKDPKSVIWFKSRGIWVRLDEADASALLDFADRATPKSTQPEEKS